MSAFTSANGTFETCRLMLPMSVLRLRPESGRLIGKLTRLTLTGHRLVKGAIWPCGVRAILTFGAPKMQPMDECGAIRYQVEVKCG
jgi:hypothetical protein